MHDSLADRVPADVAALFPAAQRMMGPCARHVPWGIDLSQSPFDERRSNAATNADTNPMVTVMDQEFDQAVQALQIKHGLASILLSIQGGQEDVIAMVRQPRRSTFSPYARVHRDTMQVVRLRA